MRIDATQLEQHLKQNDLSPVYLLSGDEPLQATECADALRKAAFEKGFTERVVFTLENRRFDWHSLTTEAGNLSLFAQRRLLEVPLGNKLPSSKDSSYFANTQALTDYLQNPPGDTLLLLCAGKTDSKTQKYPWFKALEKSGTVVNFSTPASGQMPAWVRQRARQRGVQLSAEAVEMLAELSDGHLPAAAQEIEKLYLLCGNKTIGTEEVLQAVADNARVEIFAWTETVLSGNAVKTVRGLRRLREEGSTAVQINALLEWELRRLCQISQAVQQGRQQTDVFAKQRIWGTRKKAVGQALQRYRTPQWLRFLRHATAIDAMIKGVAQGNPWDELNLLACRIAGVKLFAGYAGGLKN